MPNTEIVIPTDLNTQINERVAVWSSYDTATQQAAELASLAPQAQSGLMTADPITTLTTDGLPPLEIEVALSRAKAELDDIARVKSEISTHEAEIARLIFRRKSLIISVVVMVGFAIFAIVSALPK